MKALLKKIVLLFITLLILAGCNIFGSTDKPKEPEYIWSKKEGFANHQIYELAVNPQGVLVAETSGGFYRAHSVEDSFEKVTMPFYLSVAPFRNIFVRDSLFYIATMPVSFMFPSNQLWSSKDGMNWHKVTSQKDPIFDILVTADEDRIFGTWHGIYRQRKGVSDVELIKFFYSDYFAGLDRISSLRQSSSGSIFGGCHDGIYRTNDHGTTWQKVSHDISKHRDDILELYIDAKSNIFAQSENDLYKSADNGQTWQRVATLKEFGVSALFPGNGTVVVGADGQIEKASLSEGTFRTVKHDPSFTFRELGATSDGKLVAAVDSIIYIGTPNPDY